MREPPPGEQDPKKYRKISLNGKKESGRRESNPHDQLGSSIARPGG
jgi:hypothetical protein